MMSIRFMSVTVKYFAVLRELSGKAERQVIFAQGMTAMDVWTLTMNGKALPENVKVAVNMEYAKLGTPLHDGDEVAFFPAVTGG